MKRYVLAVQGNVAGNQLAIIQMLTAGKIFRIDFDVAISCGPATNASAGITLEISKTNIMTVNAVAMGNTYLPNESAQLACCNAYAFNDGSAAAGMAGFIPARSSVPVDNAAVIVGDLLYFNASLNGFGAGITTMNGNITIWIK